MICNKVEKCIEEQLVNQKTTACVNKNIECIEVSDNRSRIKCEERKKKYILENKMCIRDSIYTGNGVSELINLCMQALLDNGDEILIPAPDYPLWTATATLRCV